MAHHKRKRPKIQRAGCTCKFWKHKLCNKANERPPAERRRLQPED